MEGLKKKIKAEYFIEGFTWIVILLLVVFKKFTPARDINNDTLTAYAGLVLCFAIFYYYILYKILPYSKREWIKNIGDVILIGILIHLSRDFGIYLSALLFLPIVSSMFVLGTLNSLLIAIFAVVVIAFEILLRQTDTLSSNITSLTTLWPIVSLLIITVYTRALAHQIKYQKNLKEEAQKKLALVSQHADDFEKLQKEFVSLTAHQLYTPLTVIRGFQSMILDEDAGKISDKQKEYLQESHHYTVRMIHLIKELLNISRVEGGHYKLQPKPINILTLIQDTIKELDSFAKEKNIEIVLKDPPQNLPPTLADKEKTPEIFLNILHNAVKYSHKNGKVEITLQVIHRDNVPYLKTDITDYGAGIPEDEQRYVFQRFFRATNILCIDNHGTGLGLFIAKRLVEEQGGSISFTSKVGKSTTFSVVLPLARP